MVISARGIIYFERKAIEYETLGIKKNKIRVGKEIIRKVKGTGWN